MLPKGSLLSSTPEVCQFPAWQVDMQVPNDTNNTDHLLQRLHRCIQMPAGKLLILKFEMVWIHARLHRNYNERWYSRGNFALISTIRMNFIKCMVARQFYQFCTQASHCQSNHSKTSTSVAVPQATLSQRHIWTKLFIFTSGLYSAGRSRLYGYTFCKNAKRMTLNDLRWPTHLQTVQQILNTNKRGTTVAFLQKLRVWQAERHFIQNALLRGTLPEGTSSTARWRLRYWLLNLAGRLNQQKVILKSTKKVFIVFAKMHIPHCGDRRLEMQRPVTTKREASWSFKASRPEFFRTGKHMIRKQCSLSDLDRKGSWIVMRILS